jgi:hypothetical protein
VWGEAVSKCQSTASISINQTNLKSCRNISSENYETTAPVSII